MKLLQTKPSADGFAMPGEFEPHQATVMIWPVRPGTWREGAEPAQKVFAEIAGIIASQEKVYLLAGADVYQQVKKTFAAEGNIRVLEIETDDAWARDVAPTFVRRGGVVRGISWCFNAWGGEYDGLYADYISDDMAAERICEETGLECYDAYPFVLEGGAIHTDGEGTLVVTESCLLSAGRNPDLSKEEIEQRLKEYLGIQKIIWLPDGIYGDETNGHVDNMCAFTAPGEVVLAWTEDREDPQYALSQKALSVLERERDAKGRALKVKKLLIPKRPICIRAEHLETMTFAPGEMSRSDGDRLAASYVNYYVCNAGVLVPQFGDENDSAAVEVLQSCFPEKKIYPVETTEILLGGGNIHCITQQIPSTEHGREGGSL